MREAEEGLICAPGLRANSCDADASFYGTSYFSITLTLLDLQAEET